MNNPYQPPVAALSVPEVEIPEELAKDIRNGWVAACVSGVFTLIIVLVAVSGTPILNFDAWAFLDVALIFGLAFGVYRKSRVASTILLIYFVISKILLIVASGQASGIVMAIIFGLYYTKAMIATYKIQALQKATLI